jgi:acetyltransferase-like isoleucine patch superfamily enzyme
MPDGPFRMQQQKSSDLLLDAARSKPSLWQRLGVTGFVHQARFSVFHPILTFDDILNEYVYPVILAQKEGLIIKGRIILKGFPLIDITEHASITIGNHVTLNSRNKGYHINLHSPVKLFADRPGAEIMIGESTRIHGTCIHAHKRISIGKGCLIAGNTQIFDSSGHDLSFPHVEDRIHTIGCAKPITIEDNVWIGANCLILPGTSVGSGSVIAAGSVVVKSIPPFVIAGGNPAKVIKDYSTSHTV